MDHKEMVKHAMHLVTQDMGRAAREGRARRFTGRPGKKGVELTMGELTLEPTAEAKHEHAMMGEHEPEADSMKEHAPEMSPDEMDELVSGLQR